MYSGSPTKLALNIMFCKQNITEYCKQGQVTFDLSNERFQNTNNLLIQINIYIHIYVYIYMYKTLFCQYIYKKMFNM